MSKIQFFTRLTTTRFGGVSRQLPSIFIGVTENGILRKVVILVDTVGYQEPCPDFTQNKANTKRR